MDLSTVTDFLQTLPNRDPQELSYIAAGLLAAVLLFLYLIRGRRSRDGKPLVDATPKSDAAPAAAKADAAPPPQADPAPAADPIPDPIPEPEPVAQDEHPADDAAPAEVEPSPAPLTLTPADAVLRSDPPATPDPDPTPLAAVAVGGAAMTAPAQIDLTELGVYTPHFDFADSDAFRDAIRAVRDEQSTMATDAGVIVPVEGAAGSKGAPTPIERLAARAFTADCDVAIASVQWNSIDQMEQRIERTQASIDQSLAGEDRRLNPDFVALKLKELRLTHEQREKAKEEKDLRAELARRKKEEQLLTKDAMMAEKEEQRIQQALTKANQQAQKASGDEAFALQAEVGNLTRELEAAHAKAVRAREMVENTNAGFLYVASNVGAFGEGIFKVGATRRANPELNIEELAQESVPFPFDTHAIVYSDDVEALRDDVYAALDDHRMNKTGAHTGFFSVALDDIAAVVTRHAPDAAFTSGAEAQGYHQTLAQLRQDETA